MIRLDGQYLSLALPKQSVCLMMLTSDANGELANTAATPGRKAWRACRPAFMRTATNFSG